MEIEDVLNEYRQGSTDRRMSLFLFYREHRNDFARIEQESPTDTSPVYAASGPAVPSMFQRAVFGLRNRTCCGRFRMTKAG